MRDFIELQGASCARYRFRLWPEGAPHASMAGHYAYVRVEPGGATVLAVGAIDDLSKARADWPAAAQRGATHIYTRLNVPRAVREAEHADLAARYPAARAAEPAG